MLTTHRQQSRFRVTDLRTTYRGCQVHSETMSPGTWCARAVIPAETPYTISVGCQLTEDSAVESVEKVIDDTIESVIYRWSHSLRVDPVTLDWAAAQVGALNVVRSMEGVPA